jgi:CRISPR-associated endonuclease/helicase Cas3
MFLAHSANDHGKRHELPTHLRAVADKAAEFAGSFGSGKMAWYLGLWHDLGKFSSPFQQYLLDCEQNPEARGHGPDHKAAGAEIARKHLGPFALLVQGHHGGLQTRTDLKAWLEARLNDAATVDSIGY